MISGQPGFGWFLHKLFWWNKRALPTWLISVPSGVVGTQRIHYLFKRPTVWCLRILIVGNRLFLLQRLLQMKEIKPGTVCHIIYSMFPGNVGKHVVAVGMYIERFENEPATWRIQPLTLLQGFSSTGRIVLSSKIGLCDEDCLEPIEDLDQQDETLLWKKVPTDFIPV